MEPYVLLELLKPRDRFAMALSGINDPTAGKALLLIGQVEYPPQPNERSDGQCSIEAAEHRSVSFAKRMTVGPRIT